MSVTQGSTGCKHDLDANDGFDGPLYTLASEVVAKQRAATTEKVLKGARKVAKANPEAGEMTEPPPVKTKKALDPKTYAIRIYDSFKRPLAFFAGEFYALDKARGWCNVTQDVEVACDDAQRKDGSKTIYPLLVHRLRVPNYGHDEADTIYWAKATTWESKWTPVPIAQHEVLFSDVLFNCVDNTYSLLDRVPIFGPRVTLPYLHGGDEEPYCQEFEDMVERAFPDAEIRRHFQEVAGLTLTPHHVLRGQVVLVGPPKSGKTTLATAIGCAAAGRKGLGNTTEYSLVTNKWAVADLLGKFVNLSDDSRAVKGWPGFAKTYTSGRITVEVKLQMPITTLATAKLWSTCNEMQGAIDASGAMADRLFPFRVEGRVPAKESSEMMTIGYWCKPERRAGIIRWMLEGLSRYWERGGEFDSPAAWLAAKDEASGQADPLEGWLREHVEKSNDEIKRPELLEKIPVDIMPRHNADVALAIYLKRLFGSESKRVEREGERVRVYTSIRWK